MRPERGRADAPASQRRRPKTATERPPDRYAPLLRLQATAGNRATTAALAAATAQRAGAARFWPQPVRESQSAGGVLTLDGGAAIQVGSAFWSQTAKFATEHPGRTRYPELYRSGIEPGDIELTLAGEQASSQGEALWGRTARRATLRLDRRSTDGTLPATAIELTDVMVAEVSRTKGDPPVVKVRLTVGGLSVAGLGKEAKEADAIGRIELTGRGESPPIPVLSWEGAPTASGEIRAGGPPIRHIQPSPEAEPFRARIRIAAGPSVRRFFDMMSDGSPPDMVFTHTRGPVFELFGVHVEKMSGSGTDMVHVELVAERGRRRP